MPRISSSLLRHAYQIDPLLPLLLRSSRDLSSARNELRWLREHTLTSPKSPVAERFHHGKKDLYQLCLERSKGKPLQYILGDQPFGEVDILCKPGVLIPRPETEVYTTHLAHLLLKHANHTNNPDQGLRILDLCTGTGCIPLLLCALLSPHIPDLSLQAIDVSPKAISLAKKNLQWNIQHGHLPPSTAQQLHFVKGDILDGSLGRDLQGNFDILISNPPYISSQGFETGTARSVRNWEPKLALVPSKAKNEVSRREGDSGDSGDVFYPRLLDIAEKVSAKIVLLEVADMCQAWRVANMACRHGLWDGIEIWRDWVGTGSFLKTDEMGIRNRKIKMLGEGNGRVVICWSADGGRWIGRGN